MSPKSNATIVLELHIFQLIMAIDSEKVVPLFRRLIDRRGERWPTFARKNVHRLIDRREVVPCALPLDRATNCQLGQQATAKRGHRLIDRRDGLSSHFQ